MHSHCKQVTVPCAVSAFLALVLTFYCSLTAHAATHTAVNKSTNWAGYQISIPNNSQSAAIMIWHVPAVDCTNSGKPMNGTLGVFPGLGGVKGDLLAQVGTATQCNDGIRSDWAWWEVAPIISSQPLSYPVYEGDDMSAEVAFSQGTYQFYIADHTQNWISHTQWTGVTTTPQSVECIVEDVGGTLLPQFAPMNVTDCTWGVGFNPTQPISTGENVTKDEIWKNDAVQKAATSDLGSDGASFSVDWVNF